MPGLRDRVHASIPHARAAKGIPQSALFWNLEQKKPEGAPAGQSPVCPVGPTNRRFGTRPDRRADPNRKSRFRISLPPLCDWHTLPRQEHTPSNDQTTITYDSVNGFLRLRDTCRLPRQVTAEYCLHTGRKNSVGQHLRSGTKERPMKTAIPAVR
jgi:hypothetical protein